MTVFYRGPCARVTHEVIEVWCPAYRWFVIRDLSHIYVVEQVVDPPPPIGSVRTGSTGVASATALIVTLGWATDWRTLEAPVLLVAIIVLLVTSVAVSGACWGVRPHEYQLGGVYRGQAVIIYQTADSLTFGQVRRALTRAIEVRDTR